jgi:DNA polymerase-3 subunit delta'
MQFSQVIGQQQLKKKLITSIRAGRVPHAQLFYGPDGAGSLALALAYAQYVACLQQGEEDSCGECSSCRKMAKLLHPDLHFSFPVNTTKKVSKDPVSDDFLAEWREFVLDDPYFRANQWYDYIGLGNKQGLISKRDSDAMIRKLNLKSFESDYKIMIVWLPEKMNASSANVLLKLIEEPPPKTLFLYVSEDPGRLLVTIASRLQHVKLDALDDESMKKVLREKHQISGDDLDSVIRLARGSFIEAMEIIQVSEENESNFDRFGELMRFCWSRDYIGVNTWVEDMAGLGREKLKSFFTYALRLVRENFVLNLKKPEINYLNKKEAGFSARFHPYINGNNVIGITEEFTTAISDIERNGNTKIVLFDMSLRIMKLIRIK